MSPNEPPSQQQPPPPIQTQPDNAAAAAAVVEAEKEGNPLLRTAAFAVAILGPIALVLPTRGPRGVKSTLQNAVLGGASFWGVNRLAEDYTGKSITARSSERWGALLGITPAEEGREVRGGGLLDTLPTEAAARNKALMAAERRRRAEAEGREYKEPGGGTLFERFWMGKEREGWQEKRLEEERKALESGKGYAGLIVDQVKEVFGKGGEGDGDGKKDGEEGEGEGKGKGKGE